MFLASSFEVSTIHDLPKWSKSQLKRKQTAKDTPTHRTNSTNFPGTTSALQEQSAKAGPLPCLKAITEAQRMAGLCWTAPTVKLIPADLRILPRPNTTVDTPTVNVVLMKCSELMF